MMVSLLKCVFLSIHPFILDLNVRLSWVLQTLPTHFPAIPGGFWHIHVPNHTVTLLSSVSTLGSLPSLYSIMVSCQSRHEGSSSPEVGYPQKNHSSSEQQVRVWCSRGTWAGGLAGTRAPGCLTSANTSIHAVWSRQMLLLWLMAGTI